MPDFGLVLVVFHFPPSFMFSLCLVICYVTTYKSISDKLGKKKTQNITEHFESNYYYILIFTELLFQLKFPLHHDVQKKFVFDFPSI